MYKLLCVGHLSFFFSIKKLLRFSGEATHLEHSSVFARCCLSAFYNRVIGFARVIIRAVVGSLDFRF